MSSRPPDAPAPGLAARRYRVTGRVQGVFFRASTARVAEGLGLRGLARNLADGSVEVLAVGPLPALDELGRFLAQGPPRARVAAVTVVDEAPALHAGLTDFRTG
jgi:acylphosphatase